MPVEAPAPAAPPPTVTIVESATPPKPPPPPTSTIRVSEMPAPVDPASVRRGSAMDRLKADLGKKAKPSFYEQESPSAPPQTVPQDDAPGTDPPEEPDSPPAPPSPSSETTPPPAATTAPSKDKKVSPWKLVDEFKARAAALEKELADTKTRILPEADREVITKKLTDYEKRNQELEQEISFVAYQKSADFQKNYQEPYEKAWKSALSELSEIQIEDGAGGKRAVAPEDLLTLVQMPLGQAREMADANFGAFADDVMAHRKEIKNLFAKQQERLTEMKAKGAERDKELAQQAQAVNGQVSKVVKETWEKVNSEVLADPKIGQYFKPKEGNIEWNNRLAKGTELVSKAFNERPDDPRLSPEERASIIKRHAAVWNRAASWGALRHENETLQSQIASLQKELESYKGAQPSAGGSAPEPASEPQPASAMGRMFAELRKKAH